MTVTLTPLKKAAILLVSLDDETADGLLAQMEPAQAARVRREMAALGEVDAEVQRHVVSEFRRHEPPPRDPFPTGIELDGGLAERISRGEPHEPYGQTESPADEPPPFRFLHQAEADTLVDYLKHERPQTIALVLSHLSPAQAADLIDRLAPAIQAQVLRRLAELDDADPAILRDVERQLESWISEQLRSRKRRQAGLDALTEILSAAGGTARRQIITNLTRHDSSLAETLGFAPPTSNTAARLSAVTKSSTTAAPKPRCRLRFAELMNYDNARLQAVIKAAEADVLVLALAGADAAFVERVIASMPARQARLMRRALKHLGPTRLSDVEDAQHALANLADELETGENVEFTPNRFATAAVE